MNVAWSGLADAKYYELIAKYCLPSWQRLPGDIYVICDDDVIDISSIRIVQWNNIYNRGNLFTEFCNCFPFAPFLDHLSALTTRQEPPLDVTNL